MQQEIEAFLDYYNIEPNSSNGRSFVFDCPSCEGASKLYIQKKDGRSVCFKQGNPGGCPKAGKTPFYALSLISGMSPKKVKEFFYGDNVDIKDSFEVNIDIDEEYRESETTDDVQILTKDDLPFDMCIFGSLKYEEAKTYLNNRGITDALISKYNIFYSPSMRRVIFPVIMNGKMVGWQGRAIDVVDKAFRMHNLPGPWKSKSIMFYDNMKGRDFAILAEGPISAMKFENVGGFIASMGKEVSSTQLKLIGESGIKKLYMAFDRDALDKCEFVTYNLSKYGIKTYIVLTPDNRDDFGDATFEECEKSFNEAQLFDGFYLFPQELKTKGE